MTTPASERVNLTEARSRVTRDLEWLVAEFAEAVKSEGSADAAAWERWQDELEASLAEMREIRRRQEIVARGDAWETDLVS